MKYRVREGIIMTKLCGVSVLIPTREAFDHCHTIQRLPLLWAATWEGLVKGKTLEETIRVHEILTKKPREEVIYRLEQFYEELADKGFLVRCPEDDSVSDGSDSADTAGAAEENANDEG